MAFWKCLKSNMIITVKDHTYLICEVEDNGDTSTSLISHYWNHKESLNNCTPTNKTTSISIVLVSIILFIYLSLKIIV